jgi:signal transduction histidine kinase
VIASQGGTMPTDRETSAGPYETHTAVAVLCSELAHEISPTLAFIRDLVRSGALTTIDNSIGEEEVARLETVVASLRRTRRGREPVAPVGLEAVALRAAARAVDELPGARRIVVEVPHDLRVAATERALELMLVSLLRNALRAARRLPVVLRARFEGEAWCVEVEDDGQGLPDGLVDHLFMPLSTLGPTGRGTGIPTVLRVARDHGWDVTHARRQDHTIFTVRFDTGEAYGANEP